MGRSLRVLTIVAVMIGVALALAFCLRPGLREAAAEGDVQRARMLLRKGADVNAPDRLRMTALHWAARGGHYEVVKVLLVSGARVDASDKYGWTPLHFAACQGNGKPVEALLQHGAAVNASDQTGWTPLHCTAAYGRPAVAEILIGNGADVDKQTRGGALPRRYRDRWGCYAELYLDGSDRSSPQIHPCITALNVAVEKGDVSVARVLLEEGAASDIGYYFDFYLPPLHEAARRRDKDMVKLLVSMGVDIHGLYWGGMTTLHTVAEEGDSGMVALLVALGADVNREDESGQTPKQLAEREGHRDVVRFLNQHGATDQHVAH